MNIKLYRWERALDLVKKFKVHAETLLGNFFVVINLGYRERYLRSIDQDETHPDFMKLKSKVLLYLAKILDS